jgi:hypothetical protein
MNDEYYRITVNITSQGFFPTKFNDVKKTERDTFFSLPTIFPSYFYFFIRENRKWCRMNLLIL